MFGQLSEQLKKSAKPVNTVIAANTKTLETLSGHQTALFTGLLSDSVNFMQAVSAQPTVKGMLAAQSDYAESMRDRFTNATKETYSALSVLRDDVTLAMKSSIDESVALAEEAKAEVAPAPKAPAKATKAAPKPAAKKAAPKPAPKAEPKPVEAKAEPVVKEDAKPASTEAKAEPAAAPAPKKPATRARRTTAPKKTATPKTSTK